MRIIDENGIEISTPDLTMGRLVVEDILIAHHDAVEAVEEVSHYDIVAEYPNGGKDVVKVVDVPGVEAAEAWDEYEKILRYVLYTKAELIAKAQEEKRRPLSALEILGLLLPVQVNALDVDDNTALRMMSYYPEWAEGTEYPAGHKVQRDGKLWRVMQAHTSQVGWEPENAASLWTQVNETYSGEESDPIPYEGNMVLEDGKFYSQDGALYRCTRSTEAPVYHALTDLVGLYVEAVE